MNSIFLCRNKQSNCRRRRHSQVSGTLRSTLHRNWNQNLDSSRLAMLLLPAIVWRPLAVAVVTGEETNFLKTRTISSRTRVYGAAQGKRRRLTSSPGLSSNPLTCLHQIRTESSKHSITYPSKKSRELRPNFDTLATFLDCVFFGSRFGISSTLSLLEDYLLTA